MPYFDIGDRIFAEHIVVMKNLTGPTVGLHFSRRENEFVETTYDLVLSPHFTMQVERAMGETSAELQSVFIVDNSILPPMTIKTFTVFFEHLIQWGTAGTVTPVH